MAWRRSAGRESTVACTRCQKIGASPTEPNIFRSTQQLDVHLPDFMARSGDCAPHQMGRLRKAFHCIWKSYFKCQHASNILLALGRAGAWMRGGDADNTQKAAVQGAAPALTEAGPGGQAAATSSRHRGPGMPLEFAPPSVGSLSLDQ